MSATIEYKTEDGLTMSATHNDNEITVRITTLHACELEHVDLTSLLQRIRAQIATPINSTNLQDTLNIRVTMAIANCRSAKGTTTYNIFLYERTEQKIVYLGQLAQQDRKRLWQTTKNLGPRAMQVLDKILATHGLRWNMTLTELGNWKPPTED